MPGEWRFGENGIEDLIGFGICWVAKVLHEQMLGRWPGRQHLGELARRNRRRLDEFCGCGGELKYSECCFEPDSRLPLTTLVQWIREADARYLEEIRGRGLTTRAPTLMW
jgi:hypothetical protein